MLEFEWENSHCLGFLVTDIESKKPRTFFDGTGYIWYPASFQYPTDQFEKVIFQKNSTKIYSLEMQEIKYQKPCKQGFEILKDGIINENNFHESVIKFIKTHKSSHKSINKRQIFYLDQIEKQVEFNLNVFIIIKNILDCSELELWNAFVSYIPKGLDCPDQIIHRDCLYDSVSIFFYLDDSNTPKTQFFPFTNRLIDNLVEPTIPNLSKNQVLIMDGKLLHGGIKGIALDNRYLYVFQYRNAQQSRSQRIRHDTTNHTTFKVR